MNVFIKNDSELYQRFNKELSRTGVLVFCLTGTKALSSLANVSISAQMNALYGGCSWGLKPHLATLHAGSSWWHFFVWSWFPRISAVYQWQNDHRISLYKLVGLWCFIAKPQTWQNNCCEQFQLLMSWFVFCLFFHFQQVKGAVEHKTNVPFFSP